MTENTFPVYSADVIVNFYRTEILTSQEAKHLTKSDLTPVPKVKLLYYIMTSLSIRSHKVAEFQHYDL